MLFRHLVTLRPSQVLCDVIGDGMAPNNFLLLQKLLPKSQTSNLPYDFLRKIFSQL